MEWSFYNNSGILIPQKSWEGGDQLSDVLAMVDFFNGGSDKKKIVIYESKMGPEKVSPLYIQVKSWGKQ